MQSAIKELAAMEESELFAQIAEGAPLIVENAARLSAAAGCLSVGNHGGVAATLDIVAGEEAAKILVLLDVVRCPCDQAVRKKVLSRFNDHLAKGIYAKACAWLPVTFDDLKNYVQSERASHYLDGPHDFDWIMKNEVLAERERHLYVDFVRYFEAGAQACKKEWSAPYSADHLSGIPYHPPGVLAVVAALHRAGATTRAGLDVIASAWREFEPNANTRHGDILGKNMFTLKMLESIGAVGGIRPNDATKVVQGWPWPLWSLDLGLQRKNVEELRRSQQESLAQLR